LFFFSYFDFDFGIFMQLLNDSCHVLGDTACFADTASTRRARFQLLSDQACRRARALIPPQCTSKSSFHRRLDRRT
jgi:hypothetical protein